MIDKGDVVYYARIHPKTGTYDLCELHVRTVYESSFVGVDKSTKQAFFVSLNDIDKYVFDNREDALRVVKEAEKDAKNFTIGEDE